MWVFCGEPGISFCFGKKKALHAIRKGDWKLIIESSSQKNLKTLKEKFLFNLASNSQEEDNKNLINNPEYAQIKKELMNKFLDVRKLGKSLIIE